MKGGDDAARRMEVLLHHDATDRRTDVDPVYIKTGERTFFEYIMKPVFDSFSRAFRET